MAAGGEQSIHRGAAPPERPFERGGLGTGAVRGFWATMVLLPSAVFVVAAFLSPDPAGHGTHTQLGLPPCGFLFATGVPCPGCGLTTSFAHMIRLQVADAFSANPFGVLFFLVSAASIPVSIRAFVRATPVFDVIERYRIDRLLIGLSVLAMCVWGWRVIEAVVL